MLATCPNELSIVWGRKLKRQNSVDSEGPEAGNKKSLTKHRMTEVGREVKEGLFKRIRISGLTADPLIRPTNTSPGGEGKKGEGSSTSLTRMSDYSQLSAGDLRRNSSDQSRRSASSSTDAILDRSQPYRFVPKMRQKFPFEPKRIAI